MPAPTVYVETSIIGYLTSRPSSNSEIAGHQVSTRKWWETAREKFTLVISQAVLRECGDGNPEAAKERLAAVADLELVPFNDQVESLIKALLSAGAVPSTEPEDAAHIALAAVHGVEYLVTWNFKHIANASCRRRIEREIEAAGLVPPTICSIDELAGDFTDVE